MATLSVFNTIPSTNQWLLDLPPAHCNDGQVCMANEQTAGRGRRGREWHTPAGGQLALSMAWHFPEGPTQMMGLTLALGVVLVRCLHQAGVTRARLKWPNDVVVESDGMIHKLAGILVETAHGNRAVMGLGVNWLLPRTLSETVGRPITDVTRAYGFSDGPKPFNLSRESFAARLLEALTQALPVFLSQGLGPFLGDYAKWDMLADRTISVTESTTQGETARSCRVVGVDESGGLRVALPTGEVKALLAGEVSVICD